LDDFDTRYQALHHTCRGDGRIERGVAEQRITGEIGFVQDGIDRRVKGAQRLQRTRR
jgi:hypothetical protein